MTAPATECPCATTPRILGSHGPEGAQAPVPPEDSEWFDRSASLDLHGLLSRYQECSMGDATSVLSPRCFAREGTPSVNGTYVRPMSRSRGAAEPHPYNTH